MKGIGKTHAKWSPVATAWYRLLPEVVLLTVRAGGAGVGGRHSLVPADGVCRQGGGGGSQQLGTGFCQRWCC